MAQKRVKLDRESFSCSICLDLLRDPATLACGHSYCMDCIKTHWDGEEPEQIYSCPQCRYLFTPRPVLVKSTMLADLVEELKKTGPQAAPADHCYAGPEDVACDYCSSRKRKAFKSCLVCLTSYCEKHLQPHHSVVPLQKHKLVEPSKDLQENLCCLHDEVMNLFCRTDQQCICYLCSVDEHKGHDTVSAEAERTERQKELDVSRLNIQQRITDREKDVKLLQQQVEAFNGAADEAVEHSEKTFTELIRGIQIRSSDLKDQLVSIQEFEVSRVKDLQEKLEQEITLLKRKEAELRALSNTEDQNYFLTDFPSLPPLSDYTHSSSLNAHALNDFEDVTEAVSEARDELQDALRQISTDLSLLTTEVDVLEPQPELKIRSDFLRYACQITLNPNTANADLLLSEGNRKATRMRREQPHSSHTERFTCYYQALSKERLTGRCYFEVEWTGRGAYVAVAYKSISRAGSESRFGQNDKSWMLDCDLDNRSYTTHILTHTLWHNKVQRQTHSYQPYYRIGVYLDHSAGLLSFYSVFCDSEFMRLIHRVQTRFTHSLYAGVCLYDQGDTAECMLLK